MLTENPRKNPFGDCTQSKIKDSKTINKGRCDFFPLKQNNDKYLEKVEKDNRILTEVSHTTKAGQACLKSIQYFSCLYVYHVKFIEKEFSFNRYMDKKM